MDKFENIINTTKLNNFLKKQEIVEKKKNKTICVLTILGVVVAVALVAYGVYKYLKPDYLDDFEDDMDDEFDEDFFEDEFDAD